jgi:hypothetical protein
MKRQNTEQISGKGAVNSLSFTVKIKRGIAWSVRRIELDREKVKYFNPKDNELRFSERIDDCNLIEKHSDNIKKYSLKLVSKTKKFDDVKISCDDKEVLKSLKREFDTIVTYNSTMSSIQNKTFVIQSDKNGEDKLERKSTFKTIVDDNKTVHKSIFIDENTTNYLKSVYNQDVNTDMVSTIIQKDTEINLKTCDLVSNFEQPDPQVTKNKQITEPEEKTVENNELNLLKTQPLAKSEIIVENSDMNDNKENPRQIDK